jgi:hypothetical protein
MDLSGSPWSCLRQGYGRQAVVSSGEMVGKLKVAGWRTSAFAEVLRRDKGCGGMVGELQVAGCRLGGHEPELGLAGRHVPTW